MDENQEMGSKWRWRDNLVEPKRNGMNVEMLAKKKKFRDDWTEGLCPALDGRGFKGIVSRYDSHAQKQI